MFLQRCNTTFCTFPGNINLKICAFKEKEKPTRAVTEAERRQQYPHENARSRKPKRKTRVFVEVGEQLTKGRIQVKIFEVEKSGTCCRKGTQNSICFIVTSGVIHPVSCKSYRRRRFFGIGRKSNLGTPLVSVKAHPHQRRIN